MAAHIRDSALCGTCHTLYTTARRSGGKEIGAFPEQMPYQEWLHSDYREEPQLPVVPHAGGRGARAHRGGAAA